MSGSLDLHLVLPTPLGVLPEHKLHFSNDLWRQILLVRAILKKLFDVL